MKKKKNHFILHDKPPSGQRLTAPGGHLLIPKALLHICHPAAPPLNGVARTSSRHTARGLIHYINSGVFLGGEKESLFVLIITLTTIEQLTVELLLLPHWTRFLHATPSPVHFLFPSCLVVVEK